MNVYSWLMKQKVKYLILAFFVTGFLACSDEVNSDIPTSVVTGDTLTHFSDSLRSDSMPLLPDDYASGIFRQLEFGDVGDFIILSDSTGKQRKFYGGILGNGHPLLTDEDRFKGRSVTIGWKKVKYYYEIEKRELELDSIVSIEWTGFLKTIGEGGDYVNPAMAISSLQAGDTLEFLSGVYSFPETLELWGMKNVTITGPTDKSAILVCETPDANIFTLVNCQNIRLHNLSLIHFRPEDESLCEGNIIALSHCNNITIKNCEMSGCSAVGVRAEGCRNVLLVENHIHDISMYAVQWNGEGLQEASTDFGALNFRNNLILNNGYGLNLEVDSLMEDH